jgi:hypothetical protein
MQEVLAHPDHWDLVLVEENEDGLSQYLEVTATDAQPLAYGL